MRTFYVVRLLKGSVGWKKTNPIQNDFWEMETKSLELGLGFGIW